MKQATFNAFRVAVLWVATAAASFAAAGAENIVVRRAWARSTVPGQPVGAAYLEITSADDASLVALHSDAARSVEMHNMQQDGDVMRMRQVDRLPLPAARPVKLSSGGTHIMLFGLKRPLRAGESLGLDLTVADSAGRRRTVHVSVPIRADAPAEDRP